MCVLDGTMHIDEISSIMPRAQLVVVTETEVLYTNFISGVCNVIVVEPFDILPSRWSENVGVCRE